MQVIDPIALLWWVYQFAISDLGLFMIPFVGFAALYLRITTTPSYIHTNSERE